MPLVRTLMLLASVVVVSGVALPPLRAASPVAVRPWRPKSRMPGAASPNADAASEKVSAQYLVAACASSGILRASSDVVSQLLRDVPLDLNHAAAMGTVGIFFSGLIGAMWLRHLEDRVGSGTSFKDVTKKSAADFLCYAPCANSSYLFFVPLLTLLYSQQPFELATLLGTVERGFLSAMALELCLFAPYNLFSFTLIPAAFRPHTTAAACAAYTVGLSSLC